MNNWIDYQKEKMPKHVIVIADMGDYTDKVIRDYKNRIWSETEKAFLLEKPIRWKIT